MGARDYFVPESFIKTIGRGIKGFKDLSAAHQARAAHYVWIAGSNRRKHKKEEGMSIGYMDLERGFGRGGFKVMNDSLNLF